MLRGPRIQAGTGAVLLALLGAGGSACGGAGDSADEPRGMVSTKLMRSSEAGSRVKVIDARGDKRRWSVWLFGNRRGENCWATRWARAESGDAGSGPLSREITHCGIDIPPRKWELISEGPRDGRGERSWALVIATRRDVGELKVLTGRERQSGGLQWTSVRARRIGQDRARRARLRDGIGYAVAYVRRPGCLRRVTVIDRTGRPVGRSRMHPCRFIDEFDAWQPTVVVDHAG